MRNRTTWVMIGVLAMAAFALAQQPQHEMNMPAPGAPQGKVANVADDKFGPIPGTPQCLTAAIQNGDPMSGAFVALLKVSSGCTVPMHWHTANEELMFVSGSAQFQMKGDQQRALSAGAYVYGPAKHQHTFTCTSDCMLYLSSDGAFDIHYVDKAGNEIPMEKALAGGGK